MNHSAYSSIVACFVNGYYCFYQSAVSFKKNRELGFLIVSSQYSRENEVRFKRSENWYGIIQSCSVYISIYTFTYSHEHNNITISSDINTQLYFFHVLLTVHLNIFISVINQLDAQYFCFRISLFHASTCFEHTCSSSGGQNCITQPLVSSHWNKWVV